MSPSLPGVLALVASVMLISAAVLVPPGGEMDSMAHTLTVGLSSDAAIAVGRDTVAAGK